MSTATTATETKPHRPRPTELFILDLMADGIARTPYDMLRRAISRGKAVTMGQVSHAVTGMRKRGVLEVAPGYARAAGRNGSICHAYRLAKPAT